MKWRNTFAAGLAILLTPGLACADNRQGLYIGGGLSQVDAFRFPQDKNAVEVKTSEIFAGYKYNSWLGLEARAGFGENSERVRRTFPPDRDTININYRIENYHSIYYKPEVINEVAKLYGLFGYTSIKRSASFSDEQGNTLPAFNSEAVSFGDAKISGSELHDRTSGFSYGIGVGFVFDRKLNINIEYRNILRNSEERIAATGVYFDYRF